MVATPFPNQPPSYEGTNLVATDLALGEALARAGVGDVDALHAWGGVLGARFATADLANRHPPRLVTHDRSGERVDTVEFHDAWHALMALAMAQHRQPAR